MNNKLIDKDEMGILPEGVRIPYVCFTITKEQMESLPKNLEVEWYEVDGRKLFDVRDKDGNSSGEQVAFLLLKEKT